jgi:hypothetical protein
MKVNCLSCGYSVNLDDAYGDYEGPVKCFVCGVILQVRTEQGYIKQVGLTDSAHWASPQKSLERLISPVQDTRS